MKTVLTDHAKNKSPVTNDKLKAMVENLNGHLYRDRERHSYILVQGSKVAVIKKKADVKLVVTSFANVEQRDRYERKKRFKPVDSIS